MSLPPLLTLEERQRALEMAKTARRQRAKLKDDIRAGRISLAQTIQMSKSNDALSKMKVSDLLESLPGVGKVKAIKIMEKCGIANSRRLRGLGAKQILTLLKELD